MAFLRSSPPSSMSPEPALAAPTPPPAPSVRPSPTPTAPTTAPTPAATPSGSVTEAPSPAIPLPVQVAGCPYPAAAPITAAPGRGKTVALTFDDGSGPFTPEILAVLSRFHVHATFFDTGLHDSADPQSARAVIAAGDVIGSHTYHHFENWGFRGHFTLQQQRLELTSTATVLRPILGHDPCVMRPPGGAYDARSLALVRSLGMSLVMWTTDAEDWRQPPVLSAAAQRVIIGNAEEGVGLEHPIVLMHAGKASHERECAATVCAPGEVSSFRGNTVAALPTIIRFYLARGYTFVTL